MTRLETFHDKHVRVTPQEQIKIWHEKNKLNPRKLYLMTVVLYLVESYILYKTIFSRKLYLKIVVVIFSINLCLLESCKVMFTREITEVMFIRKLYIL